jgi:hypothetical protein
MKRLLFLPAFLLLVACEEPQKLAPQSTEPTSDLVATLARAYQTRDVELFASLLANDLASHAEFVFLFEPAHDSGETQWGRDEEIRLHRRMFHPEAPAPGEEPVPQARWLERIVIQFTPLEPFQERRDLYSENGGELDSGRWRAADARHASFMLFESQDTDYLAQGESNFVVLEDLTKNEGDPGKFLLYMWEDLCRPAKPAPGGIERLCLNGVKEWYR